MYTDITIRPATADDAEALVDIYAPYVEHTAITYEYAVPSVSEFRSRIINTLKTYPYIVAEKERLIVGYAYAGQFKERAAYSWCVETTIYVKSDFKRGGIGSLLYTKLEDILYAPVSSMPAALNFSMYDRMLSYTGVALCLFLLRMFFTVPSEKVGTIKISLIISAIRL
jgi:hypothetical protein